MLTTVQGHRESWPETFVFEKVTIYGFDSNLPCKCQEHSLILRSSSKIGDLRIVDSHIALAYSCSGMPLVQFQKFCEISSLAYSPRTLKTFTTKINAAVTLLRMELLAATQQVECRVSQTPEASAMVMRIETDVRALTARIWLLWDKKLIRWLKLFTSTRVTKSLPENTKPCAQGSYMTIWMLKESD